MTSVTRWLMLRSRAPSISMACRLRPSSFACVTLALSATAFCHIYFKLWAALGAAPNQTHYWIKVKGRALKNRSVSRIRLPCIG